MKGIPFSFGLASPIEPGRDSVVNIKPGAGILFRLVIPGEDHRLVFRKPLAGSWNVRLHELSNHDDSARNQLLHHAWFAGRQPFREAPICLQANLAAESSRVLLSGGGFGLISEHQRL